VATTPEATLTDLSAVGDAVWASGTRGFLARRGVAGWSSVSSGGQADLNALAPVSDTTLVAVGAKGTILRITDGVVTTVPVPVPIDLYGVTSGPLGVIACGRGGTLLKVGLDEATLIASGTTAGLKAVRWGGDGALWIAGAFGTLLRTASIGSQPEVIASGVGGALNGLAASPDGIYAVGDNGVILRATAAGVVLEHEAPGAFLYAIATTADQRAVAAGASGLILVRRAAGWEPELATEPGATFEAVYVAEDGAALVGGVFRLMHLESRRLALEVP